MWHFARREHWQESERVVASKTNNPQVADNQFEGLARGRRANETRRTIRILERAYKREMVVVVVEVPSSVDRWRDCTSTGANSASSTKIIGDAAGAQSGRLSAAAAAAADGRGAGGTGADGRDYHQRDHCTVV